MATITNSDATTTPAFPLDGFPQEIRDLIWEFTLPDRRLFHIKTMQDITTGNADITWHIKHPPPVATSVCQESRAVALRHGFFLSNNSREPGFWFNPKIDVLYGDRNQRKPLASINKFPHGRFGGWNRMHNFGFEWRAFFLDTPHPEDVAETWRVAIEGIHLEMPALKTLHYILPQTRYKGGPAYGREPHGVQKLAAELVPLPEETMIPWGNERNVGEAQQPGHVVGGLLHEVMGMRPMLIPWKEVKKSMELAFEELETGEFEVRGWWLVRPDDTNDYEGTQVRTFTT